MLPLIIAVGVAAAAAVLAGLRAARILLNLARQEGPGAFFRGLWKPIGRFPYHRHLGPS